MTLLIVLLLRVKNHTAVYLETVVMTNGAHQCTAGNKVLGIGQLVLLKILLMMVTIFLLVVLLLKVVLMVNGVLLYVVMILVVLLLMSVCHL